MEYIFLSTLSLRRATKSLLNSAGGHVFLSTLSLRRATALRPCKYTGYFRYFYPRSPCGERQQYSRCRTRRTKFLSTLSLRRATVSSLDMQGLPDYFYPRSPCGERRGSGTTCIAAPTFLSTLSLRRATSLTRTPSAVTPISIHALLAESDQLNAHTLSGHSHFYPRSPCGERHPGLRAAHSATRISIHALLAESDSAK